VVAVCALVVRHDPTNVRACMLLCTEHSSGQASKRASAHACRNNHAAAAINQPTRIDERTSESRATFTYPHCQQNTHPLPTNKQTTGASAHHSQVYIHTVHSQSVSLCEQRTKERNNSRVESGELSTPGESGSSSPGLGPLGPCLITQ
jgi:hypothetical protein